MATIIHGRLAECGGENRKGASVVGTAAGTTKEKLHAIWESLSPKERELLLSIDNGRGGWGPMMVATQPAVDGLVARTPKLVTGPTGRNKYKTTTLGAAVIDAMGRHGWR